MMYDGTRCRECGDEVAVNEALITNGYHVECEPLTVVGEVHDEVLWGRHGEGG